VGQFFTVSHADKPIKIIIQVNGTLKNTTQKKWKESSQSIGGHNLPMTFLTNNERMKSSDRLQFITKIMNNFSLISGSLSPQHGASSGSGWRNSLQ